MDPVCVPCPGGRSWILSVYKKQESEPKYLGARLEKLRVETEPYMQQNEYVVHAMKGGRVANANLSHFLYNQVGFPTYMGTHRHSIFHLEMTNFRF